MNRNMRKIIVVALVVLVVWWWYSQRQETAENSPQQEQLTQTQETQDSMMGDKTLNSSMSATDSGESMEKETVQPKDSSMTQDDTGEATPADSDLQLTQKDQKVAIHYFTKGSIESCSATTVIINQTIPDAFRYATVAALVQLTNPLPQTYVDQGFASALVPGTRLINLNITSDGHATAEFNAMLNEGLNDCTKRQRTAQIVDTLKEFQEVKTVSIFVEGKEWK